MVSYAYYLLLKYYENPFQYIYRNKVRRYWASVDLDINFRNILSNIRVNDVIICSTDKGLKLPHNSRDIRRWVNRVNSQVTPYLKRLSSAKNNLLRKTENKYNIVDPSIYPYLSSLIDK